ncbi:hypothetical protein SUGI_0853740, partial [Cryptomeria japonica]
LKHIFGVQTTCVGCRYVSLSSLDPFLSNLWKTKRKPRYQKEGGCRQGQSNKTKATSRLLQPY